MKKAVLYIFAALIFTGLVLSPVSEAFADKDPFYDAGFIQVRKKITALEFTLPDLNGNQVKMSDHGGKTVLLYFWATW